MTAVEVLCTNIETVRRSRALGRLVRKHRPDVAVVLQAYRAGLWLRVRFSARYKVRQYPGKEARGIAVLVRRGRRRGVRIERRQAWRMRQMWTGPKAGIRHDPRTYPDFRLTKQGVAFGLLAVHFPTLNQGINAAAMRESFDAVTRWFDALTIPGLAVGDYNREAHQLAPLVTATGATLRSGGKVDHALVRGMRATVRKVPKEQAQPLTHGWSRYVFEIDDDT